MEEISYSYVLLAGLLSFLSPCVLPIVPGYLCFIAGTSLDIVTKVIHHDDKQILMQADIFIDGKHVSTGTAHEFRAESKMHQTSYVELCDTSCIGRALAMAGLINDRVASAEEVSLAIEQSNKKLQAALKH